MTEYKAVMIISSAVPLGQELTNKIRNKFRENIPAELIDVKNVIDTCILAGFKVTFAGKTHDFSAKGRLEEIGHTISDNIQNIDDEIKKLTGKNEKLGDILRERLKKLKFEAYIGEEGKVVKLGDGIAIVEGLTGCMSGELLEFENNVQGMALNLDTDSTGCVLFGSQSLISEGSSVRRTGSSVSVPVGYGLLGRTVDPLGRPMDGKGKIMHEKYRQIECTAPGIIERKAVTKPLQTGILSIDSMIPIGKGQRELIIGDRQTGKTAICIDTIINQKSKNTLCVYVAIGQKASTIAGIIDILEKYGAMEYTTIVCSTASDMPAVQYIAPYAGCSIAEHFMYEYNRDVLIIYDDLSKHAVAYRTISLLLKRPPGREAYPGDVFYLHSRLLERAAAICDELGGGTLTALPVVETVAGDLSAYIPTNIISITDGQIYLETDLFFAGQRPAINVGLSVSRVGSSAQTKAMCKIASSLRIDLAQYRELSVFAQFGSDLDAVTRSRLVQGERLTEALKQPQYEPMPLEEQIVVLYTAVNGHLVTFPLNRVREFNIGLIKYIKNNKPDILHAIADTGELSDNIIELLESALGEYKKAVE